MATLRRAQPFWFGNTLNATCPLMVGGPEYPHFKETAGAANRWLKGDLLYLDSNGTIELCTTSSSIMTSPVAGQALKAATGTTGEQVYFHAIRPDDLWVMNVMHATPASATTAQTQLGVVYGLRQDTVSGNGTGIWSVDIENTTVESTTVANARVQVVGFPLKNPFDAGNLDRPAIGDIYGLVIVKFIPFSIGTDGAPIVRVMQLA